MVEQQPLPLRCIYIGIIKIWGSTSLYMEAKSSMIHVYIKENQVSMFRLFTASFSARCGTIMRAAILALLFSASVFHRRLNLLKKDESIRQPRPPSASTY